MEIIKNDLKIEEMQKRKRNRNLYNIKYLCKKTIFDFDSKNSSFL